MTLTIVPPAPSSSPRPRSTSKPGATVEIKGKIVRKGGFDGPVTVKINGLPAGLKADPVTLTGATAMDFVVKIVADAKAAPASAKTQVAIAYQIDKKDYSCPPRRWRSKCVGK